MTSLLCKLFIKDRDDLRSQNVIRAYGTLSSVTGIILNIFLAAIKFFAGLISGSLSITADAVNNLSDAGSQVISFISFKLSAKPADKDHPFGHARFEYISSLIISVIIIFVGFELAKSSIEKIFSPEAINFSIITVIILAISIIVKFVLYILISLMLL